ncbi:Hypothetical predicted protein [Olea europaea subsp. europaea]|uniref:Pentatricopeptide repeat-containing protein n=1 Tax=Olea europaea subsp. europaea TaxID=158383 RepID=A0A8S0UI81_OLEEU|nr:Hypothetical predicted protein [Olea europaea subsp. europaea]
MEDSRKSIASWSAVIAAYANMGMWSEYLRLFGDMNQTGLRAEIRHYGCLVDLLGRAGMLNEAIELIKEHAYEAK